VKIHRIRLAGYRGVPAREVEFADTGVTVVQGPNEIGKSSLAEAIDVLLEFYDDSKSAAVRAIKPANADVGTEIELDLTAGPYRLTYAKRFNRERSTTLTVHEPVRQQLTGREAHDRVRAILAETVDLALWRALRFTQGQAVGQPDLADTNALAAALDVAAGGASGGDREQTVLERAEAEFARYFTPTGLPNAWFKGLQAEFESAQTALREAQAALTAVEHDVERCASLARELAALQPEHQQHTQRLAELEQRWTQVQRQAEHVARCQEQAERLQETLDRATHARSERQRLVEAVAAAADRAQQLAAQRDAAAPELQAAQDAEQAATTHLAHTREQLTTARTTLRQAQEAVARSRDAFSLELLEERWARVVEAREQAQAARAVLDATTITEDAVVAIEQAALAAAQAQAGLDQEQPRIKLRSTADTTVEIDGAPVGLTATQALELQVSETTRLTIGEVEATITPGHGLVAVQEAAAAAQHTLTERCERYGVKDLADARAALRRRDDAARAEEHAERLLRDNVRDLTPDELEHKVLRLREQVSAIGDTSVDVDAAKRASDEAERAMQTREEELEEAQAALRGVTDQRNALHQAHTTLKVRAEDAAAEHAQLVDQLSTTRALQADQQLDETVSTATAESLAAHDTLSTAQQQLATTDSASVEAAVENARAKVEKHAKELREREDELTNLQGRLSALGEVGLQDRLVAARTRHERAEREWQRASRGAAAAQMLRNTLQRHREQARQAYRAPLRDKLESLGRIVFGADFSVELNDELRIVQRTLNGVSLDVDQLSTGAQEQLAVLSRLAVAAITASDGGVPVLLDDALGWSDPARLERMGAAFHVAARDSQVIVLTCTPERYRHIGSAHTITLSP